MRHLHRRHRRAAAAPAGPVVAPRAAPPEAPAEGPDLTELEAQAQYHRDRLALYRARMHSSHPTSIGRLAELERASATADERLRTARRLSQA